MERHVPRGAPYPRRPTTEFHVLGDLVIFGQRQFAWLSLLRYLIGDPTIDRVVIVDPQRDVSM